MPRPVAPMAAVIAAAAAATFALPPLTATAAPAEVVTADATAKVVVTANGGLVGRVRPSTHAPANYTFAKGTKLSIDCRVPGTVVGGNSRWYLVVAEGDANWISARYVSSIGAAPEPCDPSDGTYAATSKAVLNKRVGPSTADAGAGTYAKGAKFRVQCYTNSGQKWYLTDGSRWVSSTYVSTSSKVRYCSNF